MRRFPLALILGALLATTACQGEVTKEPAVDETEGLDASGPAVQPLSQEEANTLAFRAAWEAAAPVTASDPAEGGLEGSFEFRQGVARDLGAGLFAFVSSGVGEDGAGAVAIHYLVRTEDGYRESDVDPLFVSAGTGGDPQWAVRTDITPQPLLVVQSRATGSGRTCTNAVLVELTPSHPVLRAEAVPMEVASAEGGDDALTSAFERGALGRDFTVQYSGASDAEVSYVFTDMGFYRAMNAPNLPDC